MCLYVATKKFCAVQKGYKVLKHRLVEDIEKIEGDLSKVTVKTKYMTPYMGQDIPFTGWLFPKKKLEKFTKVVMSRAIHSYTGSLGLRQALSSCFGNKLYAMLEGYAIHVFAQGQHADIASRALYLPHMDIDPERIIKTIEILDNCPKSKKKSTEYLIEHFPFLANKL